jgi:hypothetical protein
MGKYLLLMTAPAKPDAVIQVVTGLSTPILSARSALDIFHSDEELSCRFVSQSVSLDVYAGQLLNGVCSKGHGRGLGNYPAFPKMGETG